MAPLVCQLVTFVRIRKDNLGRISTAPRKGALYSPLLALDKAEVNDRIPKMWPAQSREGGKDDPGPESSERATRAGQLRIALSTIHEAGLTYLFKSAPSRSGLTPTKFRIIFAIKSSRNTTISCPINFIRHGFEPNTAWAILFERR